MFSVYLFYLAFSHITALAVNSNQCRYLIINSVVRGLCFNIMLHILKVFNLRFLTITVDQSNLTAIKLSFFRVLNIRL